MAAAFFFMKASDNRTLHFSKRHSFFRGQFQGNFCRRNRSFPFALPSTIFPTACRMFLRKPIFSIHKCFLAEVNPFLISGLYQSGSDAERCAFHSECFTYASNAIYWMNKWLKRMEINPATELITRIRDWFCLRKCGSNWRLTLKTPK